MRVVRFRRYLPRGNDRREKGGDRAMRHVLTASQKAAVERSGQNVCVVAGPGSGKTRVLIERFAWLVESNNIAPSRILAITFTEKAATEIKQRLLARFSSRAELRASIERAWVSTIDGFCARLLRENAIEAGIAPDFAVLEESAAQRLARESADETLEEIFREDPDAMRRLLEALDLSTQEDGRHPDLARGLLEIYEAMRVSGVHELPEPVFDDAWPQAIDRARDVLADRFAAGTGIAALREWASRFLALPQEISREHFSVLEGVEEIHLGRVGRNGPAAHAARELKNELAPLLEQQWIARWNADLLGLLREAVARIAARYRERKRREASLDFADLEEESIRLLESNREVREKTRARFDEVLMDELQDTNRLQWRLIERIVRRLFAVGDINQSIYGFRHAEPAVFEQYRDGLARGGFAIDDLRENHRSTQPILDAVSRALDGAAGIEPRALIAARGAAVQGMVARGVGEAVERMVASGDNANEVEATMIASRICEVRASGVKFRDIAILVRTMTAAGPIERALDCSGIPFVVSGGRTFLEAREIRDAMALLAALANPLDEVALVGVLRSPLVGLTDEELFRIGREGWMAVFEKHFGKFRGQTPPDLMLAMALDECGYTANLAERAQANIEKFLAMLRRNHRSRTLAAIVEEMEALRALQSEAKAPPADAGDLVQLMSMHAAKGLEFPAVFVAALHRGPDLRKPVIVFSASAGLGAKWRNPATGKGTSDTAHARIVEEMKRQEKTEENRLLYVAMTRAENLLVLSHAAPRGRASGWLELAGKIPVTRTADRVEDSRVVVAPAAAQEVRRNFVDAPVLTDEFDSSAAATAIATFHACPRKYLLNSIDTRVSEHSTGAVALGSEVHRVLAGGTGSAEAVELAARFQASPIGRRAARATRVEREFDFLLPVGGLLVRGQIDLWFEEAGELILLDYKTDRDESSSGVYALQLSLYALALERYAGKFPDRSLIYYLRTDRTIEVQIDCAEASRAVESFAAQSNNDVQELKKYPIRPGFRCRRCAYFQNLCPAQLSVSEGF
jgi:ATP-dependent helicase/nuclease subunit A